MTRMRQFARSAEAAARADRGRSAEGAATDRARPVALDRPAADARLHPRPERRRPLAQHGGRPRVRRHARQADHADRRARIRHQGAAGVRREAPRNRAVDGGDDRGPDGGGRRVEVDISSTQLVHEGRSSASSGSPTRRGAAARGDELGSPDAAPARRAPLCRRRPLHREHRKVARHLGRDCAEPRARANGPPRRPHAARGRDPGARARIV